MKLGCAKVPIEVTNLLHFLARDRTRLSRSSSAAVHGDPLSSAVLNFHRYNKNVVDRLGIEKIIIRTRSGEGDVFYSLTDGGGHIPRPISDLQSMDNLVAIHSKATQLDPGFLTSTSDGYKAQVVAYIEPADETEAFAVKAFCDFLVNDFISSKKEMVSKSVERGLSDVESLYQMARDQSILPGTFAIKLTRILAKSLGAKLCAFAVIDTDSVFLEYATLNAPKKRERPYIIGGKRLKFSREDEFERYFGDIRHSGHKHIEQNSELHSAFCNALSSISSIGFGEYDRITLSPVVYDNEVLGVLVFVFDSVSHSSFGYGATLVSRACRNFSPLARYLHQRRINSMIVDPIFSGRDTGINKSTCFVIMPFGENWSDTVSKILKEVLADEGISTIRADEMHGENVMEDVWNAIVKSEFMIADVTGKNPNVYYELGIGHTLGKKILLLTQSTGDIPFDTRHLRHIVYSNDLTGFDSIRNGVKGFLAR